MTDAILVLNAGSSSFKFSLFATSGQDLALVAPYPRQFADSWLERLVQPLVTWSWAATMPLRWATFELRGVIRLPSISGCSASHVSALRASAT